MAVKKGSPGRPPRYTSPEQIEGLIEEYFKRTASKVWAYVTEQGTAYIMNETEFRTFLYTFGKFEQDSTRNGGKYKVRFPRETKAMLAWLAMRA